MSIRFRLQWISAAILLGPLALAVAAPGCRERLGSEVHGQKMRQAQIAYLDRQVEFAVKRIKAKSEIADQVAKGKMNLFEAAAWFRYLNDHPIDCPSPSPRTPGESDNEKACRQVIEFVRQHLADHGLLPSREEEIRKLEITLADHLAWYGTVLLPEPGESAATEDFPDSLVRDTPKK